MAAPRFVFLLILFSTALFGHANTHRLQDLKPHDCIQALSLVSLPIDPDEVDRLIAHGNGWLRAGRLVIQHLLNYPQGTPQAFIIAAWEQMARALIEESKGIWTAARYSADDGSTLYVGIGGYCLVFKIDGSIYKGRLLDFPKGGVWTANYSNLTMVRPPLSPSH